MADAGEGFEAEGGRLSGDRTCVLQPGPGSPWWGMQGGLCCFPGPLARRRPSRREMSEGGRVEARTPCRMPHRQPAASSGRAVILSAGSTKGTSVVSHGSATKMPPAARGRGPLDPRLPWHVGFERAASCRQEHCPSQRNRPSCGSENRATIASAPPRPEPARTGASEQAESPPEANRQSGPSSPDPPRHGNSS